MTAKRERGIFIANGKKMFIFLSQLELLTTNSRHNKQAKEEHIRNNIFFPDTQGQPLTTPGPQTSDPVSGCWNLSLLSFYCFWVSRSTLS